MNTYGVRFDPNILTRYGRDLSLSHHTDDPLYRLILVLDHSSRLLSADQSAVLFIGPVSKHLAGATQSQFLCRLQHLRASQSQKNDLRVKILYRSADGCCKGGIPSSHVIQGAVRFQMLYLQAVLSYKCRKSPQLIQHIGIRFVRSHLHFSSAKAHKVRETRMRAHSNAVLSRHC